MKAKAMVLICILLGSVHLGFSQLHDVIRLKLSSGPYSDETIVRFLVEATDNFDSDWDAHKLSNAGNTPNFYSRVNNTSYSINALNITYTEKIIPLYANVAFTGTYSITSEILGAFDSTCVITLEDNVTGASIVVDQSLNYTFDAVQGSPADRFVLRFTNDEVLSKGVPTSLMKQMKEVERVYSSGEKIVILLKPLVEKTTIRLIRVGGKELYYEMMEPSFNTSQKEITLDCTGLVIVEMMNSHGAFRQKVFVESN